MLNSIYIYVYVGLYIYIYAYEGVKEEKGRCMEVALKLHLVGNLYGN